MMERPYCIVPATEAGAMVLARRLRAADKAEVMAQGLTPEEALLGSLRGSLWARMALLGGRPFCMWGVEAASLIGGVGYPWLLGSPLLDRFPRDFLRESRAGLAEMLETFERLEVFVDARYGKTARWMRWLGFVSGDPVFFGDVPFLPFERRR